MKSVSEAQLYANQANAQLSRGPKTPEGKAASARNHFSHGLTGEFTVLPWENQEEFNNLLVGLRDEHKPATLTENLLIGKMAQAAWLSKAPRCSSTPRLTTTCPAVTIRSSSRSTCATKPRTTARSINA